MSFQAPDKFGVFDPAPLISILLTLQFALLLLAPSGLKLSELNLITKGSAAATGVPAAVVQPLSEVLEREAHTRAIWLPWLPRLKGRKLVRCFKGSSMVKIENTIVLESQNTSPIRV